MSMDKLKVSEQMLGMMSVGAVGSVLNAPHDVVVPLAEIEGYIRNRFLTARTRSSDEVWKHLSEMMQISRADFIKAWNSLIEKKFIVAAGNDLYRWRVAAQQQIEPLAMRGES